MRKRVLTLLLALTMCLGLCVPASAVYTVQSDSCTYELSNDPIGTLEVKIPHYNWLTEITTYETKTAYILPDYTTVASVTVPDGRICFEVIDLLTYEALIDLSSTDECEPLIIEPLQSNPIANWPNPAGYLVYSEDLAWRGEYATSLDNGVCLIAVSSASAMGLVWQELASSTPDTPLEGSANVSAAPVTAAPTASTVLVNGEKKAFDAYNIEGSNYFKLRDLAYVLNGTDKQFEVGWDAAANAISLTSGKAYTAAGGEMAAQESPAQAEAVRSSSKILLDGAEVALTAYTINGNNYFKLRDLGQAFDFGVGWDGEAQTISIDTSTGYTAE